jgi:hypothetical protein
MAVPAQTRTQTNLDNIALQELFKHGKWLPPAVFHRFVLTRRRSRRRALQIRWVPCDFAKALPPSHSTHCTSSGSRPLWQTRSCTLPIRIYPGATVLRPRDGCQMRLDQACLHSGSAPTKFPPSTLNEPDPQLFAGAHEPMRTIEMSGKARATWATSSSCVIPQPMSYTRPRLSTTFMPSCHVGLSRTKGARTPLNRPPPAAMCARYDAASTFSPTASAMGQ